MTVGSGPFMLNLAVYLSTTSTLTIDGYCETAAPGGGSLVPPINSTEYFTSSAVTSCPLWNLAPCFSLKTYVLSSGVDQDSASAGKTFRLRSHCTSES